MKSRYWVIAYFVIAVWTFGWISETVQPPATKSFPEGDPVLVTMLALVVGATWPIYWSGKAGIEAVRTVRSTKLRLSCSG